MFKKLAQISLRPQQIVNQKFGSHAAIPKQLPKV